MDNHSINRIITNLILLLCSTVIGLQSNWRFTQSDSVKTTVSQAVEKLHKQNSFDMRVPVTPKPVTILGTRQLVYELLLTNFSQDSLILEQLEVLDASNDAVIASISEDALDRKLGLFGLSSAIDDPRSIAPGTLRVLYLEIGLEEGVLPEVLEHRLIYRIAGENPEPVSVTRGARISIGSKPMRFGPPLRGGPWAAIYHPSWERGHRRVFYAVDGHARLPGRFAIDWVKLDENGRFASNNEDKVANQYSYGADVLAVADGVVSATRSNISESSTLSDRLHHPAEEAEGNYIIIDLGDGLHAFYGHLRPGSIRVEPGEQVSSGQVIGAVGFTGHAARPQLHFHLADANSSLGAEGLPFTLECFNMLGSYDDLSVFGNAQWTPFENDKSSLRTDEFPAPNVVVDFGTIGCPE